MLCEAHDYKWLSLGQMGIRCIIMPSCIDCLVLYIVIVFVGLIYLCFLFLTLDQEYVDAALLYPLFHCVNGYIHVKFIVKLDFLAAWLCLTYCCCGYCRCCDEFISSSRPNVIDFSLHIILEICIGRRGFGQIN
jgi:hypothetical protein